MKKKSVRGVWSAIGPFLGGTRRVGKTWVRGFRQICILIITKFKELNEIEKLLSMRVIKYEYHVSQKQNRFNKISYASRRTFFNAPWF